jgi:methionyl-tRNA formyltransferase
VKILYFATSAFALPALQALVDHGDTLVGVVTQPDRPSGRGNRLTAPPVKGLAISLGLDVLQPESCRTPEFLAVARACAPELIVVAAYGQFLPDPLLQLPRAGAVNLHGSLLPKYRGAAPIQRAIWAGETTTGVSLMWMVRAMDAGDVIARVEEPITDEDTAGTLTTRLATRAASLLLTWLPTLAAGQAPHHPQDPAAVLFAPPIRKEECVIDWTQPAEVIRRQVQALAPVPGAVTRFRGQPVKILSATLAAQKIWEKEGEPGAITEVNPKNGLMVVTGAGLLHILSLQPAGKRAMSGADFLRGYHVTAGEPFRYILP